jgi:hypothetical protein
MRVLPGDSARGGKGLKARWVTETDKMRRRPENRTHGRAMVETAKSKLGKEIV